jgi:hypothetical protein
MENEEVIVNSTCEEDPDEIVTIPFDLFQSFLGRYYIGRTPALTLRGGCDCWGGLINPRDSSVNLFIDNISVSNTSGTPFCTRIWLNTTPFGRIQVSPFVTLANTAVEPMPVSFGLLSYSLGLRIVPFNGDSMASQIARPFCSLDSSFGGKVIIPPGGNIIVFCSSDGLGPGPGGVCTSCEISFQWWEMPAEC